MHREIRLEHPRESQSAVIGKNVRLLTFSLLLAFCVAGECGGRVGASDHQCHHGEWDRGQRFLLSDHCHQCALPLRCHGVTGGARSEHSDGADLGDANIRGNIRRGT